MLPEICRCRVADDPLVETFDGHLMLISGPGTYVLSQLRREPPTECDHMIYLDVHALKGIKMLKRLIVHASGKTVIFTQDGVFINETHLVLPFKKSGIWINKDPYSRHNHTLRDFLYVLHSCSPNFTVQWHAGGVNTRVMLAFPIQGAGYYSGICGNCDGNPINDIPARVLKNT